MNANVIFVLKYCLLIITTMYLIIRFKKFSLNNYRIWRNEKVNNVSPEVIKQALAKLFYSNQIFKLSIRNNLICFQDKFSLRSWGNYYVVEISDSDNSVTLYRRGILFVYHDSKELFQNIITIFELSKSNQ